MNDLLKAFAGIAEKPEIGTVCAHRSYPFMMASAEQHFAIYQVTDNRIIIAAVFHGRQNIERLIRDYGEVLAGEIDSIKP